MLIWLLKISPPSKKRFIALLAISFSPHHFYRTSDPGHYTLSQFLNAENERNTQSREKILKLILLPHLRENMKVLDYGCGPGWLAKAVAGCVRDVYAVDVSRGAIESAKIINPAPNIRYIYLGKNGLNNIPNESLDLIYSFAVVQHITDSAFEKMLSDCALKLKPAGTLLLHVQLESPGWKSETEWRNDKSLTGMLKHFYGTQSFSRKEKFFFEILPRFGFGKIELKPVMDICSEQFDDICRQHLIIAKKSS